MKLAPCPVQPLTMTRSPFGGDGGPQPALSSAGARRVRGFRPIGSSSTLKRGRLLADPLAARSPGLWLALALKIERHRSADEILQCRLIDLVAFVDVDGAPDVPLEAGVE